MAGPARAVGVARGSGRGTTGGRRGWRESRGERAGCPACGQAGGETSGACMEVGRCRDRGFPHSSRRAVATGSRAARRAGKIPPANPITTAQTMPWISSAGVTLNANATWLNVCQLMVAV